MLRIALKSLRCHYVKVQSIDQLSKGFRNSQWYDGILNKLRVGKFLLAEGYKDMKSDLNFLYSNRNLQLPYQDNQKLYEIKNNLWKLGPVALLFCIPGGLPMILGYIALFPTLTPTWYLTDDKKTWRQGEMARNRREALKFFMDTKCIQVKQNWVITTHIDKQVFRKQSLLQKKRVHELCFGEYCDGTGLIKRTFGLDFSYLFFPSLSHYILESNLQERLKGYSSHESSQDQLESKIIHEARQILQNQNIVSSKIN